MQTSNPNKRNNGRNLSHMSHKGHLRRSSRQSVAHPRPIGAGSLVPYLRHLVNRFLQGATPTTVVTRALSRIPTYIESDQDPPRHASYWTPIRIRLAANRQVGTHTDGLASPSGFYPAPLNRGALPLVNGGDIVSVVRRCLGAIATGLTSHRAGVSILSTPGRTEEAPSVGSPTVDTPVGPQYHVCDRSTGPDMLEVLGPAQELRELPDPAAGAMLRSGRFDA
jgi:hypothetical protein